MNACLSICSNVATSFCCSGKLQHVKLIILMNVREIFNNNMRKVHRHSLPLTMPALIPPICDDSQLYAKQAKIVKLSKNIKSRKSPLSIQMPDDDISSIEQQCASLRSEIGIIESSDEYAVVDEMQIECLEMHQEIMRLKKLRKEAHNQNMIVSKQLAKSQFENIVSPYESLLERSSNLSKDLAFHKQEAEKIKRSIQNTNVNDVKQLFNETIKNMDSAIERERNEVQELKDKIAQIRAIQEEKINSLIEYICT